MKLNTAVIEIELRKPSMLHGKKGFEKVVYAAKNVLNHSLTWLFCDLRGTSGMDYHFRPRQDDSYEQV